MTACNVKDVIHRNNPQTYVSSNEAHFLICFCFYELIDCPLQVEVLHSNFSLLALKCLKVSKLSLHQIDCTKEHIVEILVQIPKICAVQ